VRPFPQLGMYVPRTRLADRCRRPLLWCSLLLGSGCARFGYDILEGAVLGQQGDAGTWPPGAAGSGVGGAPPGGGAGGAAPPGGAAGGGGLAGGPSDAGAAGDAGDGPGTELPDAGFPERCREPLSFDAPVLLSGLPAPPLFGPALSNDGLTLYFAANGDLFEARRTSLTDTAFDDVTPIASANGGLPELTPHVSLDGLTLFFARDIDGSGNFRDLMQSERTSTSDAFGAPTPLSALNDPFWSELSPALRADGRELFFASSRPGGPGLFDIWRAQRPNAASAFGNPQPVNGLNSPQDDSGIGFTRNAAFAILSSARDGTLGGRDLWLARRAPQQGDFEITDNVSDLNSAQNDTDPAVRSDEAELVFASDRSGQSLLYSARRRCAFEQPGFESSAFEQPSFE